MIYVDRFGCSAVCSVTEQNEINHLTNIPRRFNEMRLHCEMGCKEPTASWKSQFVLLTDF